MTTRPMDASVDRPLPIEGPADLISQVTLLRRELATMQAQLDLLVRQQQKTADLFETLTPVGRLAMDAANERLVTLEDKGYFIFGKELLGVLDRVVESYGPEDVRALGDGIVGILDTVRELTQPEVLAMAQDATDALHGDARKDPSGLFGALRATRDADVRRGLGIALALLKQVGKGSRRRASASAGTSRRDRLASMLGPSRGARRRLPAPAPARPAPTAKAQRPANAGKTSAAACTTSAGDPNTFVPDDVWSEAWAQEMATALGVGDLTEEHMHIVRYSRATYAEAGASPNIRAITLGAEVPTKLVYGLFKKAPGKTIARIAGVPKPGGCL